MRRASTLFERAARTRPMSAVPPLRANMLKPDRAAFTLIELLVATAIIAALIGAIQTLLFGGLRLRETAWRSHESVVGRERVAMILRRDLCNMVAPTGILAGPLTGEAEGNDKARRDSVVFNSTTGAVTDAEPWGDIQQIEYALAEPLDAAGGKGMDFVRRARRDLLATVAEVEEIPDARWRLLDGVASLGLEYYDGEAWLDAWDTTTVENENPKAVRLTIAFLDDPQSYPKPPLQIVIEPATQPRPAAVATSGAGENPTGGAGGGAAGGGPAATNPGRESAADGERSVR